MFRVVMVVEWGRIGGCRLCHAAAKWSRAVAADSADRHSRSKHCEAKGAPQRKQYEGGGSSQAIMSVASSGGGTSEELLWRARAR